MNIPEPILYDVAVVGGGPAGSAAAFTAAEGGLHVCLIDKTRFPRDKLCGGLLTQRSKRTFERVFHREWNTDIINHTDDVEFFSDGKFLAKVEGYSRLYFTMRRDFDAYLLELAEREGVDLKLNVKVVNFDFKGNRILLDDGNFVQYRFLVGADGVNSQVAKELFGTSFDKNTIGFGLEIEVPNEKLPTRGQNVEIDFGAANWGYGWVFPKSKSYTIGVGGIHRLNPHLRKRLANYANLKGLNISEFEIKGQYLPFGDFRTQPGKTNILLCGDAAGLVDSITGEGIAHAMQSGYASAVAIRTGIREKKEDKVFDLYLKDFRCIAKSIRQAKYWRYLIFPQIIRKPFAWAFADAGTLQRGYLDILAGKHEYSVLYGLFLIQIAKACRKFFRILVMKITRTSEPT